MRKPRPRCIVLCTDGQQCGKRCHDGMSPPMCHVHRAIANGTPINQGHQFTPKARTPEEVVAVLMNSRDESIRLRAADLFLKRHEAQRACPTCASQRQNDYVRERAIHRLTYEQRTRLRTLLDQVKALCEGASTQPVTWDSDHMRYVDEPTQADAGYVPTCAAPRPEPVTVPEGDVAEAESTSEAKAYLLDPNIYSEVGLAVDDGVITHALGDEHARAILNGTISFEDARAQQRAVEEKLNRMPR